MLASARKCENARATGTAVAQQIGEPIELLAVAVARRLGDGADALDQREEVVAFAGAQRVAKQPAEQPDVVAKRCVRIGRRRGGGWGHGPTIGPQDSARRRVAQRGDLVFAQVAPGSRLQPRIANRTDRDPS